MKTRITILGALLVMAMGCQEKKKLGGTSIQAFVDSIVQVSVDSADIAGASILVAKGDEILVKKAYGYASLELSVPVPENGVFEIGSVTKQFTAAATLKLAEAKKLSLDDDFTEYLDYDTKGKKVTIHQLLNHTSGIASFTDIKETRPLTTQDLPRDTLVRIFESKPFMFEPGEAEIYNNSAYFLLGLIIEKASGKSYEEYLQEVFFDPLGMRNTHYCSNSEIQENKVYGYGYTPKGLVQKGYLNHKWPYAAGSLCSTTEDLYIWLEALHNGKVLTDSQYQSLITPRTLNDGSKLSYAMGIGNSLDFGNHKISHNGGINGFLTDTRYYPKDDLYIIALINTTGPKGAGFFANEITWQLLEKRLPKAIDLDIDTKPLDGKYTGPVRGLYNFSIDVKSISNGITVQSQNAKQPDTLKTYLGNNTWADGNIRIVIKNDEYRYIGSGAYYILKKE